MVETDSVREKTFNIRFSEEEWARLERLTEAKGVNAASLIRMLLKQEEEAARLETARSAQRRAANFAADFGACLTAVEASGISGLRVFAFPDTEEIAVVHGGHVHRLKSQDAELFVSCLPGSKIVAFDPDSGKPVVRGSADDKRLAKTVDWWPTNAGSAPKKLKR